MQLGEVRAILKDIVKDDQRAGDVIRHLRAMMTKGETQRQPLNVNDVIAEALDLAHSDVVERRVSVDTRLAPELPSVHANPVQLKQVLLNPLAMPARRLVQGNGRAEADDRHRAGLGSLGRGLRCGSRHGTPA